MRNWTDAIIGTLVSLGVLYLGGILFEAGMADFDGTWGFTKVMFGVFLWGGGFICAISIPVITFVNKTSQ